MSSFEFRDRNIELNIAGNIFNIVINAEFGDAMRGYQQKAFALAQEADESDAFKEKGLNICRDAFENMLGTGSFETIFTGRVPNISDCSDILLYIAEEVKQFNDQNKNRAQRRTDAKKNQVS